MRNTLRQFAIGLTAVIVTGCSYSGSVYTDPNPPSLTSGLWTASADPSAILHLTTSQFGYGGTLTLTTTITTTSAKLTTLVGLAFDTSGDLWVASQDDSLLIELAPAGLGSSSGSATAIRVIRPNAGSLSGPTSLAFDAQQRLWVANRTNGTLVRFDPEQLAAGGAAVPAVILSGIGVPTSIAFDAAGALWVSDSRANTLSRYSAAQLAASGSPVPAVVLSSTLNSLVKPSGLAFDASGTLWVANTNGESVAGFAPDQLSASGTPEPRVLLSFTGDSPTLPVGLAFDGDGNLWVVGGGGVLTEFARASLGVTGAPVPSGRFQLTGYSLFWNVAFWPKPAGLPLN
jgi:sugar lactone lactonase YvrE